MPRKIFAISDLHLSLDGAKPMDVFGEIWEKHADKLAANWRKKISNNDLVLVAGDISWGMKLDNAQLDLDWVNDLPGEKVFVKGNHDYWWASIGKVRKAAPDMHFIQNDCVVIDNIAIAGTRLWDFPGISWPCTGNLDENPATKDKEKSAHSTPRQEDAEKIRVRELDRLRMSLSKMPKDANLRIAMLHFPPIGADGTATEITEVMDKFGVDFCVFGHLHALPQENLTGADCKIGNTRYILTSCDWLDFAPIEVNLP